MTVHIYADWTRPDDSLDGSQPTISGGAGPKKHLNSAKALIPNPVEDEYIILKSIPDQTTGGPDIPAAAELQILNTTLAKSAAYYGIVLTSRSLLVGANQVRFNDEAIHQGKDTVPDGQQIVAKTHSVAEE